MTERPTKQLYNFFFIVLAILLLPLVAFFFYAIFVDESFFLYIAIALFLIISFLLPFQRKLIKHQANVDLQTQSIYEKINLIEAEMHNEELAIESYREKIVNFSQLKGLTERLSLCLYLDETSKTLSAEINRLFGDQDTTIILYLFHTKTGELGISSSHKGQMRVNIKSKKGDIFDQWIVKAMQPLLIEDTKSDYRFDADKISQEETRVIRSLISVPLMVGNKALGILRIDSPKKRHFATEDLRFLTTIGDLGAVAIENAQLFERVEQLAIKDGLTGLYLRRYLLDRIPEELSRELRTKKELSFLMIDLDKFKHYNDKFGHVAGDIVIRTTGMLLADFFNQAGNLVCRYGGEEFCVVLPDCNKADALRLAEQVRKKIAEQVILLRREKTHITVSIGVASFPVDAQTKNELIHRADQALYKAKQEGRDRVISA